MVQAFYFFGLLSLAAAGYFGWAGFSSPTTVSVTGYQAAGDTVANFQLMHFQAVNFQIAGALLVTSAVLIGFGGLISHLSRKP